ncbi:MAG: SGNH/GDSL hydrolase family protein [Pseudomonadota bacterium]
MKHALLFCAALAVVPLNAAQAATLNSLFSSFFVLGDSNSDVGNLGDFGPPAPYFNRQFSNGPVWADLLDDGFETGDPDDIRTWNYAFGGARVTEDSDVPDLPTQLGMFGADLDPTRPDPLDGTPVLGDRPLVAIWFGANDIRSIYRTYLAAVDAASALDPGAQRAALAAAERAARDEARRVGTLYGATLEDVSRTPEFGDFLALTTADAGATPEYDDPVGAELLSDLSRVFNEALSDALDAIEKGGVNVYTVDIFALQEEVAADPGAFGFDNVTDPCLVFDGTQPQICATPETYLFWDEIGHLTGAAHAALAGIVQETVLSAPVNVAPVPLPATLPLLGLGVGVLAVLRKRKSGGPVTKARSPH